jgi:tetratricopeptide (TPR) repeat protein
MVALYGGDWSEAKSTLESGLARAIASGAQERQADLTFCFARLLRISGENARAIAMLEDLLQTLGDGSLPLVELWLRPECVLCHAQDTNLDEARLHLARCREIIGAGKDWSGLAGAVVRAEAVVAAMEKRLPEAEKFFERAIATFTRYSLPWEQAETLLLWGRVLAAGDERRANEKFDTAIEIYRRNGAGERWIDRVEEARNGVRGKDGTVEDQPASSSSLAENIFRKDGDFWTVTHGGRTFRLRNLKGLEYIAYLLAHPGVRIHACDLVAVVEGRALHDAAASVGHAQAHGLQAASDLGDAGEALDAQAVSSYRSRLTEVRAELAEAERNNDSGAKERAQREFEALSQQLASAVGRHGRVRRSSSHVERARALATKNIRASIERIRSNDAKLGEHFASSIRTGAFCAYLPQLEDIQSWRN